MKIESVSKAEYQKLLEIWEASVRATHDFLSEDDLQQLKPLILEQYFDAVNLTCAKTSTGEIAGFCGVHDGNIEMLFIAPEFRGQGIGALLAAHAISAQGATKVDVNEQNPQALGFYQRIGFAVTGRSPTDGQDKPYPLLHMTLPKYNQCKFPHL
ncbi:putative acetyltransferase [Rheinheimera pacifica]|uniref:acetyltransferase n=1 Tax=Rheinheimera pacifica TaxID=173990 RepID=UPI00285C8093|nr:acetyltransferase [Rheinheimera pacifica]MDR6984147.1 putative acetyltransferase [Rheinheimera pacifica]